eukprot:3081471-Prymnesium_polylepis.1
MDDLCDVREAHARRLAHSCLRVRAYQCKCCVHSDDCMAPMGERLAGAPPRQWMTASSRRAPSWIPVARSTHIVVAAGAHNHTGAL